MPHFEETKTQTLTLTLDTSNLLTIEIGEKTVKLTLQSGSNSAELNINRTEFAEVAHALGRIFPQPTYSSGPERGGPGDR